MKLRHLLSLLLVFAFGISEAQNTPPSRTRSGDGFTQVDNYITALKRLGIPSGASPTLDASTSANNTAKLFFNTTDTALYVYRDDLQEWLKVSADGSSPVTPNLAQVLVKGNQAGGRITQLVDPINNQDASTKKYVDDAISGIPTETPSLQEVLEKGNSADYQDITDVSKIYFGGDSYIESSQVALGESNLNNGYNSYIFGRGNTINPSYSAVFGQSNTVNSQPGFLFGRNLQTNDLSNQTNLTAFGIGNIPEDGAVFMVGNGYQSGGDFVRSNAYELYENGRSKQEGIAEYMSNLHDQYTDRTLVDKEYVDNGIGSVESPFNVIDVTQVAYTDKAINVKDFDNQNHGTTYSEGAIDFGVNRDVVNEMGLYSFRAGLNNTVTGDISYAFGTNNEVTGDVSYAFGANNAVQGGVAIGSSNSVYLGGILAVGTDNQVTGDFSMALGRRGISSGTNSITFGFTNQSTGLNSIAFGSNNIANESNSFVIGRYSDSGDDQDIWVHGSPVFKVGNGNNEDNRKNAYTLYNDGRSEQERDMEVTGIGQGFVLKSPDGTRYRITVENGGVLNVTEL